MVQIPALSSLLRLCRCHKDGACNAYLAVPDIPGAKLDLQLVTVPRFFQDQPLDFACELGSASSLRALTHGGPKMSFPSLRSGSGDNLRLTDSLQGLSDSPPVVKDCFVSAGPDRDYGEAPADSRDKGVPQV